MRTFSICALALMGCSLTSGVATVVMKPGASAPTHLFGVALQQ